MNTEKTIKKKKRSRLLADIIRDRQLYLLLLPVLAYYIIFMYFPMYGLQISFKDFEPFLGITKSEWVGFEHFRNFFSSPYAYRLIRNTVLISFYSIIFHSSLTIIIALLLNEIKIKKLQSFVQTVIYMPHFISTVVVAGLFIAMLSPSSGIINQIIAKLGGEKIYFLSKPEWFRTIYITMSGWQGIGFSTILYTSAICAIDESLYEAAEIDGAGRLGKMLHVTIPGIAPTIVINLIMAIGRVMNVGADAILLLYQPTTYETADVISTYVYRVGLAGGDYSFGSAVGLFNGLVSLVLVMAANKISRKLTETSLW